LIDLRANSALRRSRFVNPSPTNPSAQLIANAVLDLSDRCIAIFLDVLPGHFSDMPD
jgi:hypothetical protein